MKTRFAPSPTGLIHLGNARTALFSALLAQHAAGKFLLRIEDTDLARSKSEYIDGLIADLRWLGIEWQEGIEVGGDHPPYQQSQRMAVYDQYYQQLLDKGFAFECYKTDAELDVMRKVQRTSGQAPRYPKSWREQSATEIADKKAQGVKPALRFKVPDGETITFTDLVKGAQSFKADDIGDFVIRKADGSPSFMFCNAVDDSLMGVTHVLRGEDHLTNTPRQLMILDALGLSRPEYLHISIILGMDGQPLSKRNGSHSIQDLRRMGYFSQAVVNYMARLGHYYANHDLLDLQGLAKEFKIESLVKSAAKYDKAQLDYWQKTVLQSADDVAIWPWLGGKVHAMVPETQRDLFIQTIRENMAFPQDALAWATLLFGSAVTLSDEHQAILKDTGIEFFEIAIKAIEAQGLDFSKLSEQLKTQLGVKGKALFQPLRVALTGQLHGPQLGDLMALIGKERCVKRLEQAKVLSC